MKISLNSKLQRVTAISILMVFSFLLIRAIIISWVSRIYTVEGTRPGIQEAISLTPNNPDNYFLLATYLRLENIDDTETILKLYEKSLELNPFNYNYWFGLAEFLKNKRFDEKAIYALEKATYLAPGVVSLRWEAGLLALELDRRDLVLSNLSKVMSVDPERRKLAFAVLWQYINRGDEILESIPGNGLASYIEFLIDTNRLDESKLAWVKLKDNEELSESLYLRYTNYLINQRDIVFAKELWKGRYGDWSGIWNGSFENEPLNSGFDWRLADDANGVEISRVSDRFDGDHSIEISFDGKHNVDFAHVEQIVPVEPNQEYLLVSHMKADGITTENGVGWEVHCFKADGPVWTTETIVGTQDWKIVTLSFKTPENCDAIVVRLRRYKSRKLDRFISGHLWVDKVELRNSYLK